jgi:predicted CXXCH cytochrome family protein
VIGRTALAIASLLCARAAGAQSVLSTRHNLSLAGPGPVRSATGAQVCVFCHLPHRGTPGAGTTAMYEPYASTTLISRPPGQPSGSSRLCLSCHDGTIALGQRFAGVPPLEGPANLGTDLRRTHPVSFAPGLSSQLRDPPRGDPVKLDPAGRVQCTSCHDPHQDRIDPLQGKFLVKSNAGSALCTTCHDKAYWASNPSSHQSSNAPFDAARGARTAYRTVAENGCEACHRPHGSASESRLLDAPQPQVCLACHDGRIARTDVRSEVAKLYAHPALTGSSDLHDASEGPTSGAHPLPEVDPGRPRHAQCTDCHDAHAVLARPAIAPAASGALSGVWGIDRAGRRVVPVQYEYEICFKCHADSANQPQRLGATPPETVRRAVVDVNLRRRFDLNAPSFHPVEGPGRNADVPGLLGGLTSASVVYCSDCHASDAGAVAGGPSPRGPHGSVHAHILERSFSTADPTAESPASYALCYKCHDRAVLLSAQSGFPAHAAHVVRAQAPCSACHDWHGVSSLQGNPTNNAHLVDFDTAVVGLNARGLREYQTQGFRKGTCSLRCHGVDHDGRAY